MKWKKESVPANNQESSTSRNEDSNAPGDEKSDEIVTETGKPPWAKRQNEQQRQNLELNFVNIREKYQFQFYQSQDGKL